MVTPSKRKKNSLKKLLVLCGKKNACKEANQNIDYSEISVRPKNSTRNELQVSLQSVDITKLMNEGVNVCFFNAVIQTLHSIVGFRVYVEQTELNNVVMGEIKNLFEIMAFSNVVRSSLFVRNLNLQDYIFGNQHGAQECMAHILNNSQ